MLGVKRVVYGCKNPVFGGAGSVLSLHDGLAGVEGGAGPERGVGVPGGRYECTGGVLSQEAIDLLREFSLAGTPRAPRPKRGAGLGEGGRALHDGGLACRREGVAGEGGGQRCSDASSALSSHA